MLTVEVPLNTMLADLDETLRGMLKAELERHGFEGIEIAFDAPTREWSGPALGAGGEPLPLRHARVRGGAPVGLDEAARSATSTSRARRRWSWRSPTRSPRGRRPSRTSTGCSRRCSRCSTPTRTCPRTRSTAACATARSRCRSRRRSARPRATRPTSGPRSAASTRSSLDYVVRLTVESGVRRKVPQVRTQTVRTRLLDAPPRAVVEMHRTGGTVADGDGEPLQGRVGRAARLGQFASTDADGRFRFDRLAPGRHRLVARARRRRGGRGGPRRAGRRCWTSSSTAARPRRAAGRAASADDRTGR